MPRPLLSAAGTRPRVGHIRVFLAVVGAAAVLMLVVLAAVALTSGDPTWTSVGLALAILCGHAAVFVMSNRPDTLTVGSDEAIFVAALLVAPEEVAAALVLSTILYPARQRFLGVTERMRRGGADKLLFNASAHVLGGGIGLGGYWLAVSLGAGPVPSALLGATGSFLITGLMVVAVIRVAGGPGAAAGDATSSFLRSARAAAAGSVAGVFIGFAARSAAEPVLIVLVAAVLLYVAARSLARQTIHLETADRLLEVAPQVLAPGDVDAQIIEHACRLLACETGAITTSPPTGGDALAVPIAGSSEATEFLHVQHRLGNHRSFEREDRELLAGLAALAGPARQQRQLVTALERSEASRGAILGALAHDLRSPMAVSSSALQSLAALFARLDQPTAHSLVMAADRSNARALRILDELLALEQAALSPGAAGASDPVAAAAQVRETYGELVQVHGGPPLFLAVDVRAVGRILDNLVANAIKHAPGSSVHVSWATAGDAGLLLVDDEGGGIPEDLRAELTGPFRQRDGSREGVGLGLYLARRFAELAGGRLEIGESPFGGASMRVFLPLASPARSTQQHVVATDR